MIKNITPLFLILLIVGQVQAAENFKLDNGTVVHGYYGSEMPKQFHKENCDSYAFTDDIFTPLKDGRYTIDDHIIMVKDSCLFPYTGMSTLANGKKVEFYEGGIMNAYGNVVFIKNKEVYERIFDKELELENGQKFKVEKGFVTGGFFDGNNVIYEDRD